MKTMPLITQMAAAHYSGKELILIIDGICLGRHLTKKEKLRKKTPRCRFR